VHAATDRRTDDGRANGSTESRGLDGMGIEFQSAAHQYVYERVKALLVDGDGINFGFAESQPIFVANGEPLRGMIVVAPMANVDALVVFMGYATKGSDVANPELRRYLLQQNYDRSIGAFYVDADGDINLRYSILGSVLEPEDLAIALKHVVLSACDMGTEIVRRWGGRRLED
jgi:hypothetical protein